MAGCCFDPILAMARSLAYWYLLDAALASHVGVRGRFGSALTRPGVRRPWFWRRAGSRRPGRTP
jgi:hypothetical protein